MFKLILFNQNIFFRIKVDKIENYIVTRKVER